MPDLKVEAQRFSGFGDQLTGLLSEAINLDGNKDLKPYGIKRTSLYDQIQLDNVGFRGSFGTGGIHFRHFRDCQITIASRLGLPHVRDELDIDLHLDATTLKGALWFNSNFPNSPYVNNPRARLYFDGEGNSGVAARLFYALPGIDGKRIIFHRAGRNGREIWVEAEFEEDQIEIIGAAYMKLIIAARGTIEELKAPGK